MHFRYIRGTQRSAEPEWPLVRIVASFNLYGNQVLLLYSNIHRILEEYIFSTNLNRAECNI